MKSEIRGRQRDSNLELYRIIVMLLIIAHHYVVNSGLTDILAKDPLNGRSVFLYLFGAWGKTGINCFVLLTGYFMCQSHITLKKYIKLLFEVLFYRIAISAVFWVTGYAEFSVEELIKNLMPIKGVDTGFTSCYLLFFLFIPFLNKLIQALNEKNHIRLMILCLFTYSILGNIPWISVVMNYVSWFAVLYLIAAYIRMYPKKISENVKFWGWMTAGTFFISAMSVVCCTWIGTKINRTLAFYFVADSNKVLAVILAVCSFMLFKNIKLNTSRLINSTSASTFGVLLIHANSNTMRQWLWKDVFNNMGMYDSPWLIVHAIGTVMIIFVACVIIDRCRIAFIEKPALRLWDRWEPQLIGTFKRMELRVCEKLGIQ